MKVYETFRCVENRCRENTLHRQTRYFLQFLSFQHITVFDIYLRSELPVRHEYGLCNVLDYKYFGICRHTSVYIDVVQYIS